MAAYRSHNSNNFATRDGIAWSITITKPTGLTAGDYMVAVIATVDTASAVTDTSGWTTLGSVQVQSNKTLVAYGKTATSGDAAATNFTFTPHSGNGGTNDYIAGTLIAFSGTLPISATTFVDSDTDLDNASATQSYSGGVSPGVANNALILASLASSVTTTVSGYAVATDDPTWTERLDTNVNDTNDYTVGVASADRSAATATGAYQATFGTGTPPSVGMLIAVIEATNVTVSPAVIEVTTSVEAPTVSGGATVSPDVVSLTTSVQAPTVSVNQSDWVNPDKSSASWINPDKS